MRRHMCARATVGKSVGHVATAAFARMQLVHGAHVFDVMVASILRCDCVASAWLWASEPAAQSRVHERRCNCTRRHHANVTANEHAHTSVSCTWHCAITQSLMLPPPLPLPPVLPPPLPPPLLPPPPPPPPSNALHAQQYDFTEQDYESSDSEYEDVNAEYNPALARYPKHMYTRDPQASTS
jgi:hypothetical protein